MIYFDNSATTKPCKEALDAINDALVNTWGNPSSSHRIGLEAHVIKEKAEKTVAASLGIKRSTDGKVIFTSGGTEANNLAIFGTVRAKKRHIKNGRLGTVIISNGEHASVEVCADCLSKEGFSVLRVPTHGGNLDLEWLRENVTDDVVFASLMLVNNETGAIYDVKSAAKIIKAASPAAVIHSDCVQAYMKMPLTLYDIGVDMVSVSAHKIFSAKGAGALAVSKSILTSKNLAPVLYGGGQEDGYRSGTEALPAIAGFEAAVRVGTSEFKKRSLKIQNLSDFAVKKISEIDGIKLNLPAERLPNILNITVNNIKSETMLNYLSGEGICVSKSSACSTRSRDLSKALTAFGLTDSETDSSLRISLSHNNTEQEVEVFCDVLKKGITALAKIRR